MQTILGAGGTIGLDLARILPEYTDRVRLVGRSPTPVLSSNETFTADLLDENQTALLGNADDAYGQVWHLPTTTSPPSGREWIEMIAAEFGVRARVQVVSDVMLRIAGLFMPQLREVREMAYQYDRNYDFVSDKFNARFNFSPTSYRDGIAAIATADYGH